MEYCAYGSVGDLLNLTEHPLSEPQISPLLLFLHFLHTILRTLTHIDSTHLQVNTKGTIVLAPVQQNTSRH
jgi:hypothetical protein